MWRNLQQQIDTLSHQLDREKAYASNITFGPSQARNMPGRHRIAAHRRDDRNGLRCAPGSEQW